MVELVNVLVQRTKVQSPVRPVMESVLKDKEEGDLRGHETDRRERYFKSLHPEHATDRVEGEDKRSFTGDVSEKDDLGALENLRARHVLVLRDDEQKPQPVMQTRRTG